MDFATAQFPITVEMHNKEEFQRAGHFVPRMVDEHGLPRNWWGDSVFVAVLKDEIRDANGVLVGEPNQVLRVLADTGEELARLLNLRIVETFFGLWRVQQIQSNAGEEMLRVVEENRQLKAQNAVSRPVPDSAIRRGPQSKKKGSAKK